MIGLVVVSHSRKLAEGVCELAGQMAQGRVRLAAAGGTADPEHPIGTDAFAVLAAIESVYSDDGVVVLADLGSAVLSAETALEMLDEARRARVRLSGAPLVTGAVAAASQAAAGAALDEILAEPAPAAAAAGAEERIVRVPNPLGLHARPAARFIRLARGFPALVQVENLTRRAGPADAFSINAVLGLGARQGHELRLRATGPAAAEALDALADFISSGCGDQASPAVAPEAPARSGGLPASPGIAIGPLWKPRLAPPEAPFRAAADPEAERRRLLDALAAARRDTRSLDQSARARAGAGEAAIFDAQALFLEDPELIDSAGRALAERHACAEWAWQTTSAAFIERLRNLDDPYLRARAADLEDAAARVARRLTGAAADLPDSPGPSILAARDLLPSEVQQLDTARVLGVCLETGSASAHSVILARALGIPAVVGIGALLAGVPEGTRVAIDGARGEVWVDPDARQIRALEHRRAAWLEARQTAGAARRRPAATRDGRSVRVFANINSVAEAAAAVDAGAEGVGVLRTEFLFVKRSSPPSEDEQLAAYAAIAVALGDRPLVVRTLDAGGDKDVPYLDTGGEANPFLGWRGIRISLSRPDLLRPQLRAILRAGNRVEVLFPMISSLEELRAARALLAETAAGLGVPVPKAGVMIEVPSAVAVADQLAREADFFSIGTNDLAQYAMAAERTNARVAAIADPFQPAVMRLVHQTIRAGRAAGIPVTLCGELAADPRAAALLIGMGLAEFSVAPPFVAELKQAIACVSVREAEALAKLALASESAAAVRALVGGG